jgi:hypothetical protein
MTGDSRLQRLAAGHLILGVVVTLLAPIQLPALLRLKSLLPPFGLRDVLIAPLIVSVLCQAVLLALWAIYTETPLWGRAAGLVAGAVYLDVLFRLGIPRGEFHGLGTVTIVVAAAALLVVRALDVRLTRDTDPGRLARPGAEGLRFSIRGLMLFTVVVALLSALTKGLQESPRPIMLLTALWAMCFVAVGLAALWAALGYARPRRRGMVVLVLSPVLGAFFALAAEAHRAGQFYIMLTMLLYASLLFGSLLVVRSCGYRLVRRAASISGLE